MTLLPSVGVSQVTLIRLPALYSLGNILQYSNNSASKELPMNTVKSFISSFGAKKLTEET